MSVLLAVGLGVGACSSAPGPVRTNDAVDPRSYVEDYRESESDQAMTWPASSAGDAQGPAASQIAPAVPPQEPDFTEDNVFVGSGDSTWTRTRDDRESTFALDVDTGSYSVGRAFLAEGLRPDPDSIRVEEWVNAFDYGDPPPADGAVGVTVESALAPGAGDGTILARVAVSTQALAQEDRPPAHLTFVVDTSGSMDIRERLGLVKASLALLVQHLLPEDTIAIVTYGSQARPLLEPTPVAEAEEIIEAIEDLRPGGSTNMEAGLLMGYDQAAETFDSDHLNVVVLASDGVANVGSTDAGVLTDQITQAGEDGIHLVTVGYGMGNYNDVLMEQLADRGDGFYSYVDTFEEAERLFVQDLTPTLTVVASDAKAQVVFDQDLVTSYRLVGYENRELDDSDFTDDTVDAGELGAGHQVSALYEVQPVAGAQPGAVLGTVGLRWADLDGGQAEQVDAEITVPDGATPSGALQLASVVADTAELLKGNVVVTERGVTLADLHERAQQLADQDVAGASDILEVIRAAESAQGPVGSDG